METQAPYALSTAELRRRIDDFLREYLADKSPATVGTYRRALHELERWAGTQEEDIRFTVERIRAYKRYLMEEKGLQEVSVSTYLTALRRLCQYLTDLGLLSANPALAVQGNRRPKEHSRAVLDQREITRLLKALPASTTIGKRDTAIVFAMLYCGLSEIEIVRADIGDLEQTLLGWYLRVQGKGRSFKDQQVPVDPPVMDKFRLYLDTRRRIRPDDPLFISHGHRSKGERLNTRSVRSRISRHLEAAGVKRQGMTPHSLTHTAPVIWFADGMDLEEVRNRMRHGTLDTTLISARKKASFGAP